MGPPLADGSSALLTTLGYAAFVAVAVLGPGIALQRWLRLKIDPALVLPLGLAYGAAAAWVDIALGQRWLFPVLLAVGNLALVLPRGPWGLVRGPSVRGAVPPILAIVAVLSFVQYPLNRRTPEGDFLLDDLERIDTAFHVGVTFELLADYPPQVPGLAGVPLTYHVGPHLIRAEARRWAGVHPYDALYRFDVTLWAVALVLALRGAVSALGVSGLPLFLAGFTPLLTDFSFLLGWVPSARWWTELLGGNLLLSLVFANSVVPALAIALASLIAYERYSTEGNPRLLVAAGLLSAAVPFFKIFLAGQLLLGIVAAALLRRAFRPLLALFVPCLLGSALLASGDGSRTVSLTLDLFAPLAHTFDLLSLGVPSLPSLAAWALPFLVGSLGVRLFGVPAAVSELRNGAPGGVILACMALTGWPLAMLFRITADGLFNEAVYLTIQSGALLWIFAVKAMPRKGTSLAALTVALALALPSTVEFLWRKAATPADVVPARVLRAMDALERDSRPGDVVLMRPFSRYPPPPIVFAGRRVAFTHYMPYMRQFAPQGDLRTRERAVREFFTTEDPDIAMGIARALGARYVYLFSTQSISKVVEDRLIPLYGEGGARLFRLPDAKR